MDIQELQKLWDEQGITFELMGSNAKLKSVVEHLDDGYFLSHYDGEEFIEADRLGYSPYEAEYELRKLIEEFS